MHRDTQIGLAMAIVLIGFGAALCFPRNAPSQLGTPLPNAAALDAAIEAADVKVYPGPPAAKPAAPQEVPVPSTPTAVASTTTSSAAAAASVVPAAPATPSSPPGPAVAGISGSSAAAPDGAGIDSGEVEPSPEETEPLFHVVQSGDTLSGIAQKYLGSVARYPDLYEANRDILASPDALRLNMRLRIPPRSAGRD
jgi:LysM repeat protein